MRGLWLILGAYAAVGGCAMLGGSAGDGDAPEAPPELPSTVDAVREQLRPVREVVIPKSAPWLSEAIDIRYGPIEASAVIAEIAQRRPVRLTFEPADDPLVRSPVGAITIADHIDAVCAQADWAYTVARGVVLVNDMETRSFPLSSQPGASSAAIRLRGLRSGGAESEEVNTVRVDIDAYAVEIEALVRRVVGLRAEDTQTGGVGAVDGTVRGRVESMADPRTSVTVLPSANRVVVTAKPHLVRQVERVLGAYNAAAAAAVRVEIRVVEVDVSEAKDRALDMSAVRNAAVSWGADITPTGAETAAGNSFSVTFQRGNSWDNSQAVLRWLETQGTTSVVFEDAIEVRNNQVASVDTTQTRQYVARITRERQIAGATQLETPTVEFDELRTGWAVFVQPTIVEDLVTLRLGLSRVAFVEERPYSFDQGRIAGTNFITNDFNRAMSVTLKHGETRLITSLNSQERRKEVRRTPWLPFVGDGRTSGSREREIVLQLTANIL